MILQLCNLSSFVIFIAACHLTCSVFVSNTSTDAVTAQSNSSSSTFVLPDLNSTAWLVIEAVETTEDAHADLKSVLMNKAMRVLDKEEIVFDLEREKLELEIKLLNKKLDQNQSNIEESNATDFTTETPISQVTLTNETAGNNATLEVPALNVTTEQQTEVPTAQTVAIIESTEAPIDVAVNTNVSVNNPLTNETENVEMTTILTLKTIEPSSATVELISSTESVTPSTDSTETSTTIIVESGSTDYLKKASAPAIMGSTAALALSFLLSVFVI